MNDKKYIKYVEYFSKLFHEKKIIVSWRKNNGSLNVKIDLEAELPKVDPSFSEDEFIEVALEVLSIAKLIATDDVPKDKISIEKIDSKNTNLRLNDKVDIIKEVFLNENLIQYINVQTQSVTNVLDDVNYDILTKRSRENPSKIITYSTLLSLYIRSNHMQDDNETTDKITIELTEQEVRNMIEILTDSLSKVEEINEA